MLLCLQKILLGAIASLEVNHRNVEIARKGQEVCIKIEHTGGSDAPKMYGRHFDHQDLLVSRVSLVGWADAGLLIRRLAPQLPCQLVTC